jgi:hypothetical protein
LPKVSGAKQRTPDETKPSVVPLRGEDQLHFVCVRTRVGLVDAVVRREEEGPSAIEVGMPGVAVENNTKLLIALPLDNTSKREARNVTLTEVRLKDGTRELPATLPVNVGDIAPDGRKVVQTRFNVPGLDPSKKYELEVEGHYRSQEDREHRFQYRAELTIPPIGPG